MIAIKVATSDLWHQFTTFIHLIHWFVIVNTCHGWNQFLNEFSCFSLFDEIITHLTWPFMQSISIPEATFKFHIYICAGSLGNNNPVLFVHQTCIDKPAWVHCISYDWSHWWLSLKVCSGCGPCSLTYTAPGVLVILRKESLGNIVRGQYALLHTHASYSVCLLKFQEIVCQGHSANRYFFV